jgi:hypothetical protein
MRTLLKCTFLLFFILFNCSSDSESVNQVQQNNLMLSKVNIVDNSENIEKIIDALYLTTRTYLNGTDLSENELGNIFLDECESQRVEIVDINTDPNDLIFSQQYIMYSDQISNTDTYLTKEDYVLNLIDIEDSVIKSNISLEEKQLLVDNARFMIAFVNMLEILENENISRFQNRGDCGSWWRCWGKCVASTLGGAITGGVAGCGVGAGVGAAAGAAIAAIPSAGIATPVGAGIGAVVGCVAVGVIGSVGGGLSGAALGCD